jgi:NADH-quinone oxidoreductase subunit C
VEIVHNPGPAAQHSLLVDAEHARAVAEYLRDAAHLRYDYCSNVTGVDWPRKTTTEKIKTKKIVDGVEKDVDETRTTESGGYLEAVYHLYSMEKKHGPVVLRMRTEDREQKVHLPSLTPVWRSAEFQEREIFDLYGIVFDGHGDLRRLLMWDEFVDHPMRKDYVEPDDYEYEPTPHDDVVEKAKRHAGGAVAE